MDFTNITNGVSQIGGAAISYIGTDILQIVIGILIIILAIAVLGRIIGKFAFLIVLAGIYLIARGTISIGGAMDLLQRIPDFIKTFLVL